MGYPSERHEYSHSRSPRRTNSSSPRRSCSRSPRRTYSRSPRRKYSSSPRRTYSRSPRRKYSHSPRRSYSRSPRRPYSRSRSRSRSYSRRSSDYYAPHGAGTPPPEHTDRLKDRHTLFVGDLPLDGFDEQDLAGLFSAHGWDVASARVMGSQCYGFVTFTHEAEAAEALELVQSGDPSFCLGSSSSSGAGRIRASWARGEMPAWKRGPAVALPRHVGSGVQGLEAYEHPKERLLRLQALAAAAGGSGGSGAPLLPAAQLLPPVASAPGSSSGGDGGAAWRRPLLDYGDL